MVGTRYIDFFQFFIDGCHILVGDIKIKDLCLRQKMGRVEGNAAKIQQGNQKTHANDGDVFDLLLLIQVFQIHNTSIIQGSRLFLSLN